MAVDTEVKIIGRDADGDKIASVEMSEGKTMEYPLTPCCDASGTGEIAYETGVACRKCYEPVDMKYGGCAMRPAEPTLVVKPL